MISDLHLHSSIKFMMDHLNSAPVMGAVSDENATPKPLRITKQRGQANSAKNLTQLDHAVPTRNASLPRSRTRVGMREDIAALCSQWSNDALNVQKQRRTNLTNSSSDTSTNQDKNLSDNFPAQSGELRDDWKSNQIELSRGLDEHRVSFSIDRPAPRSVTTGSIDPSGLSIPVVRGPLIPLVPTPLTAQRRQRAATTHGQNPEPRRDEHVGQFTDQDVKRQSSFKRRLISRVLSGLASKQNSSQSEMEHFGSIQDRCDGTTRGSSDRSTRESFDGSARESDYGITRKSSDGFTTRKSSDGFTQGSSDRMTRSRVGSMASSFNTTPVCGSELDKTLAAFPSPPTFSSMATTLNGAAEMSKPTFTGYVAIPGVEITAVSEVTNLNADDGESIFVAVEVEGTLNQPANGENKSTLHHALEVAVVIDNSLFSSPATLMASCEVARHLAALLDMSDDKLTILSTYPMRSNDLQSRIVQPLSTVDARRVKVAVDSIIGSTEQPRHQVNVAAIKFAKEILTKSPTSSVNRGGRISFGHIFLLTANLSGIPWNLLHDENLRIHAVYPGIVPWNGQSNVQCNGWKLQSLYRSEPEFVSANKDFDSTSLFNRLRNVILHARGGNFSGKLTGLILEVSAGIDCSIEGVVGKKHYSSLQPGEVVTALVRVKVGQRNPSLLPSAKDPSTSSFSSELLEELNSILKASSKTLLTAKLKYRYSLFPTGTRCSITAESHVKHEAPGSEYDKDPSFRFPPQPSPTQVWVQKRQAFYLATHSSPRHAISSILGRFGVEGRDSACPHYVKLVMEELKYQARILERLEPADFSFITAGDGENLYEHFGQGLFDISDFKPLEWMPENLNGFDSGLKEPTRADKKWNTQTFGRAGSSRSNGSGEWFAKAHKNLTLDDDDDSDQSTIMGSSRFMLAPRSMATKTRNKHCRYGSEPGWSNNENSIYRLDSPSSDARTVLSDDTHKGWTHVDKLNRSDSQRRGILPAAPRQTDRPEYPRVIVTQTEEERAKLIKEYSSVSNQRSFGERSLRGTPMRENRGFPPWA